MQQCDQESSHLTTNSIELAGFSNAVKKHMQFFVYGRIWQLNFVMRPIMSECVFIICNTASLWLIGKDFDAGRDWGQEKKGMTEDEMAGWHHWLDERESEWTPGVGDGQGGLACCDSWGRRVGHNWVTEANWTEKVFIMFFSLKPFFVNLHGKKGLIEL